MNAGLVVYYMNDVKSIKRHFSILFRARFRSFLFSRVASICRRIEIYNIKTPINFSVNVFIICVFIVIKLHQSTRELIGNIY